MANRRADGYNSLKEWLKRAQNIDKEITALIQEQKKALFICHEHCKQYR